MDAKLYDKKAPEIDRNAYMRVKVEDGKVTDQWIYIRNGEYEGSDGTEMIGKTEAQVKAAGFKYAGFAPVDDGKQWFSI